MAQQSAIPDTQVAAFLKHYKWLLAGKPRERLAYRIIERQREEIARLRMELDMLKGEPTERSRWTERVTEGR
ncbi:MAG: hypothetical protein K8U57_28530 [Planctomycetes bacterium]|nr:hypothetical protein [Planctomycetota bacterium]